MKQILAHYSKDSSGVTFNGFPVYADHSEYHVDRTLAFYRLATEGMTTHAKSVAYEARLPYRDAKQALKIWGGGE